MQFPSRVNGSYEYKVIRLDTSLKVFHSAIHFIIPSYVRAAAPSSPRLYTNEYSKKDCPLRLCSLQPLYLYQPHHVLDVPFSSKWCEPRAKNPFLRRLRVCEGLRYFVLTCTAYPTTTFNSHMARMTGIPCGKMLATSLSVTLRPGLDMFMCCLWPAP